MIATWFGKILIDALLPCYCQPESKTTRGFTHDAYPKVTFRLRLRRNPLYYVVNLMVPCCLLSFVAVVTFLLQPSCSERLELCE